MPSTRRQMAAAGMELRKRRQRKVRQQPKGKATRPFGAASIRTLKVFAQHEDPAGQREAAKKELKLRHQGVPMQRKGEKNRAFGKAELTTVKQFAHMTDADVKERRDSPADWVRQ